MMALVASCGAATVKKTGKKDVKKTEVVTEAPKTDVKEEKTAPKTEVAAEKPATEVKAPKAEAKDVKSDVNTDVQTDAKAETPKPACGCGCKS
jgi:uncharacterized membrane protein